jgi:RHS repeat-associated protein
VATHTIDELERLTRIVYRQGTSTTGQRTYTWVYDQTGTGFANGIGRLTSTTFPEGSTKYAYDIEGNPTSITQTVKAGAGANSAARTHVVGATWDDAGKPLTLTYPSGRVLVYGYSDGQLASLGLKANATAATVPMLSAIQWEPFGAAGSWNWHTGATTRAHTRVFDPYGRLVRYSLGNVVRDLTYDAADRISAYTHYTSAGTAQPTLDQSFGYDELGRLTTITTATASWTIGYDASGNRTSVSLNGTPSLYTTPTTSNKLASITNPARSFGYDAAGNITSDSAATTGYTATINLEGRVATHTVGTTVNTYAYNGFGQRVRKFASTANTSTVIFVYDHQGNLLGEYSNTGAAMREYVWMQGEPVAVFTPNGTNPPNIFYIHNDHLGAPRVAMDTANNTRWRWNAEPFGTTAADNQPTPGQAALPLPLRMPGQVLDTETGLFYNWHRSYDSTTGRYTQSDPIALAGGGSTRTCTRTRTRSCTAIPTG